MLLSFQDVSFSYEDSAALLLDAATIHFAPGWTGVVGANGAGKSTILRLAAGELRPQKGAVRRLGRAISCSQRTDDPPPLLDSFVASTDGLACELRGRLRIGVEWAGRWHTLSHGERKRAQIGVALWQEPEILLLDEPTNHIDADARRLLADALATFRGIGVLVSHDRELLDALCGHCLFVEPPAVALRPGGYTEASAQVQAEDARAAAEREAARRASAHIRSELSARRQEAARADRRRSKRHLDLRDHDGRAKIDAARVSGADGDAGRRVRQLEGRVRQAEETLAQRVTRKRYDLGIWIAGARSPRDRVFHVGPGSLPLGDGRSLHFPELSMAPDDRVALTGANGLGKTTLLRHLLAHLHLPEERVTSLPQEIDASQSREVLAGAARLSEAERGRVMTVVSCLGSRPDRLLASMEPSPGEVRKLLLALGIARMPHLVVMDEPTNHLDLPAIECLESALEGCPCAMLLISHDLRFLRRLARTRWHLDVDPGETHPGDVHLSVVEL